MENENKIVIYQTEDNQTQIDPFSKYSISYFTEENMKKILKKSQHAIWLVILLLGLLGSGQNAKAQFGLFDTLWVARNQYPSISDISPNDSLYICFGDIRQTSDNKFLWNIGFHFNENFPPKFISGGKEIMTSGVANDTLIGVIIWDALTGADKDFFYANVPGIFQDYSDIDSNAYLFFKGKTYKLSRKTRKLEIDSVKMPYWCGKVSKNGELVAGSYAVSTPDSIYWRNIQYAEVRSVKTGNIVLSIEINNYKSTLKKDTVPPEGYPNFVFSPDNKYIIINEDVYSLETMEKLITYNKIETTGNVKFYRYSPQFLKNSDRIFGLIYYSTFNEIEEHVDSIGYSIYDLTKLREKLIIYNPKSQMLITSIIGNILDEKTFLIQSVGKISSYNASDYQYLGGAGLVKINYDYSTVENSEIADFQTIYPNPAEVDFILKLNLSVPKFLNFTLVDINGIVVKDFGQMDLERGLNFVNFKVNELPVGIYLLKSNGKYFSQSYKVVITR